MILTTPMSIAKLLGSIVDFGLIEPFGMRRAG